MVWRVGWWRMVVAVLLAVVSACSRDAGSDVADAGGRPVGGGLSTASGGSASNAGLSDGGASDGGVNAENGGDAAAPAEACPRSLGQCPGGGGVSNACGGVVPADRYLEGHGFVAREGQRVVSLVGEARVTNGDFRLYLGNYAGCSPKPFVYRFESEQEGKCDPTDEVFEAEVTYYGSASPEAPGTPRACDAFPPGWDLGLELECFQSCGDLEIGLWEDGTMIGDWLPLSFAEPDRFVGRMIAGQLEAGKTYKLTYAPVNVCYPAATGMHIEQSFTAQAARNVIKLDARGELVPGPCR